MTRPIFQTLIYRPAAAAVLTAFMAAQPVPAAETLSTTTMSTAAASVQDAQKNASTAQSLVDLKNTVFSLSASVLAAPPAPDSTAAIQDALKTQTASSPVVYSAILYNAKGRVTRYTATHRDASGRTTLVRTYAGISYTAAGAVNGFILTTTQDHSYDGSGRVTGFTTTVCSKSGAVSSTTVESGITYDSLGRKTAYKRVVKNGAGRITSSLELSNIVYDRSGKIATYAEVTRTAAGDILTRRFYDVRTGVKRLFKVENPSEELTTAINAWHLRQQALTGTGLIASHPDDQNFIYHEGNVAEWAKIYAYTQAYTYDEAINAMALLDGGHVAAAKRIFDFYHSEWEKEGANFSGFWSVYNVDPAVQWKRYEWRKEMGANAWMGLFCLRYAAAVTDPSEKARANALAVAIGKWAASLPRHEGAVAMTPDNPGGNPNFGKVYSTEFNIDFYALTKTLSTAASTQGDRDFFAAQNALVKGWLKNHAWDPAKGLFKRGGNVNNAAGTFTWDPLWTLDKNVWIIAAVGVDALKTEFGIDPDALLLSVERSFMIRADGVFDSDVSRASGFDFGDAANAALIGRGGMKWVEGTNQVILAYKMLAEYHARQGNLLRSAYYRDRAAHFEARNADNAILSNGAVSYTYADKVDLQIYAYTGNWKTFAGSSGASTPWVYFAKKGLNPFANPFGPI